MNKIVKRILFVILSVANMVISLTILFWVGMFFWFVFAMGSSEEVFLESSTSPDGTYEIEAYRDEPGATVDFSIKVYKIIGGRKRLIYNAYHEREVEIKWVSDSEVLINEITLDLSENETYDWRREENYLLIEDLFLYKRVVLFAFSDSLL